MGGYLNKILRVNLSSNELSIEELNWETAFAFIGGRGYGAKILYDELALAKIPSVLKIN